MHRIASHSIALLRLSCIATTAATAAIANAAACVLLPQPLPLLLPPPLPLPLLLPNPAVQALMEMKQAESEGKLGKLLRGKERER